MTLPTISVEENPPRRPSRFLSLLVVGVAVAVLLVWLIGTPGGILGKADAIGYAICHRIPARSFFINNEMPMPLCARCTGIYLGVMTSFFILIASKRARVSVLPPIRVIAVMVVCFAIMGIDGVNSYLHLFPGFNNGYDPHNWLRLVTGMYTGLSLFNLIFPVFNATVWRNPEPERSVNNLREFAGFAAVGAVVILLVLSERPIFLWVFGVISAFGVVMMLTMIGSVLFVTLTRLSRNALRWRDLAIPLVAGLTLAIFQIGVIDMIRFALTGTWAGFNLGG